MRLVRRGAVDLVISNAVMEHIDDLEFAYQACQRWLSAGGWMSHEIDFRCHGTANRWNGHWGYTKTEWDQIRANRPYLINRQPYSVHKALIEKFGFNLETEILFLEEPEIGRDQLADEFRTLTDEDLRIAVALVQATRLA